MHQPRPRRRDRRPGDAHQPGHQHHLHPRAWHALPRPPRPGAPRGLLRARAGGRRLTSRDLRHLLAPQLGKDSGDLSGGQIGCDLRGLTPHQIIERIPRRPSPLTADGLSTALFFTRLTRHVIIPALAETASTGPPPGSPLRHGDHAYKTAIADLAAQASLGIQPRSVTKRRSRQAPVVTPNTQPKLTQPVKSLPGKDYFMRADLSNPGWQGSRVTRKCLCGPHVAAIAAVTAAGASCSSRLTRRVPPGSSRPRRSAADAFRFCLRWLAAYCARIPPGPLGGQAYGLSCLCWGSIQLREL